MVKHFLRLLTLAALFWSSGCYAAPVVHSDISATIKANTYQPASWRVPAGAAITLRLENQDSVQHDWIVLYRQAAIPFNSNDEASTFWKTSIEAGKTEVVQFKAPAAAGDYPVVDVRYLDDGMAGVLTVVRTDQISK
ncbi:MAG TPA: cupredoxin domain-containing protein [Anaerolineaceae bacterium]|nr:cupredoxin domain-containing protein [Anaerolineaceae bacterium]